jgi:hypothetical protein
MPWASSVANNQKSFFIQKIIFGKQERNQLEMLNVYRPDEDKGPHRQ